MLCISSFCCVKNRKSTTSLSDISISETNDRKIDESLKIDPRMAGLPKAKKMLCLMIVNHTFDTKGSRLTPSYRSGALNQAMELKSTLENNCSCQVVLKENLKVGKMQTAIDDLVRGQLVLDTGTKANLADFDTVWLVLSSHGDWELFPNSDNPTHQADVIWGTDDTVPIHLLTKQLQKTGKPCAIVSQACRGDQLAAVGEVTVDEHGDAVSYKETKPKCRATDRERAGNTWPEVDSYHNDQIMLCSSLPGNYSFRRPLFSALIQVLKKENLSTTDVKTLFGKTCQKVKDDFKSENFDQLLKDRKVSAVYNDKLFSNIYLK